MMKAWVKETALGEYEIKLDNDGEEPNVLEIWVFLLPDLPAETREARYNQALNDAYEAAVNVGYTVEAMHRSTPPKDRS